MIEREQRSVRDVPSPPEATTPIRRTTVVGAANDAAEVEADRMAAEVVAAIARSPSPAEGTSEGRVRRSSATAGPDGGVVVGSSRHRVQASALSRSPGTTTALRKPETIRRKGGIGKFLGSVFGKKKPTVDPAVEAERLRQQQQEEQRLAQVARDEEERRRRDAQLKSFRRIAKLELPALIEYVNTTPNWHEHSRLTDPERSAVREVVAFAAVPDHRAPCATFTIKALQSAAATRGQNLTALLGQLGVYAGAAGNRRDPFELAVTPDADRAATFGAAIEELLTGFPRWVLKGAMTEYEFELLVDNGWISDVVAYARGPRPPIFQAEDGQDFMAYARMRHDDGVDPVTYQSGPLAPYVRNFHRFEAAALDALVRNLGDQRRTRPLTVVLHSAIDHNGAFHRDPNMTAVFTNTHVLALMIEGGETLDEYKAMLGPLASTYGISNEIDQVMFAGHGGSRIVELAGTVSENTVDVDEHGSIMQNDEPIDLSNDLAGAQAFFDEVLANMDRATTDPLKVQGAPPQVNRRILFNACLTNSNEVRRALTTDRTTARREIIDYITNNASLATYMARYAQDKGANVTSLGANASITQVDLINPGTGQLDLIAPTDPKVTASKLVYMAEGTEPHGVLLAALEAWANDPTAAMTALRTRAGRRSTTWSEAVIEGAFDVAARAADRDNFATYLKVMAEAAHDLNELNIRDKCRVRRLDSVMNRFHRSITDILMSRLGGTTEVQSTPHLALLMAQVDSGPQRNVPGSLANVVGLLDQSFDAKSARDFVDVPYLERHGLLTTALARPANGGTRLLALLGVLDGGAPAVCVDHLRGQLEPAAPAIPMLPAVPEVPEIPEQPAPRDQVAAVPAVPGRPAVAAIPGRRTASPEVPDLPALPELPAVAAAAKKPKKGTPAPVAPGRPGRPARPEVAAIPEVKAHFAATLGIAALLAGRSTEDEIAEQVA